MKTLEQTELTEENIDNSILNIVYSEYTYELQRTNSIDNKVYIALTISSALLAFDANQINFKKIFNTQINKLTLIYIIISFLIIGAILSLYFIIVKKLFSALKPQQFVKIDSKKIDLMNSTKYTYNKLIEFTQYNSETNKVKMDMLNSAFKLFPYLLILSVISFFVLNFIC